MFLKEFISEDSDTESENSEEENSEYSEMRRKAIKRRKSAVKRPSSGRSDRSKSALDQNLKKKYQRNITRTGFLYIQIIYKMRLQNGLDKNPSKIKVCDELATTIIYKFRQTSSART